MLNDGLWKEALNGIFADASRWEEKCLGRMKGTLVQS